MRSKLLQKKGVTAPVESNPAHVDEPTNPKEEAELDRAFEECERGINVFSMEEADAELERQMNSWESEAWRKLRDL